MSTSSRPEPNHTSTDRLRGWFQRHRVYVLVTLAILAVVIGSIPWKHDASLAGAAMKNAGSSPALVAQQTLTPTPTPVPLSASTDSIILGAFLLVLIIGISAITALFQRRKG
jgi:hypothetical protein